MQVEGQEEQGNPLTPEQGQEIWAELEKEELGESSPPQATAPEEEEPEAPPPEKPAPPPLVRQQAADPRDIKPAYVAALERQVGELTGIVKSSVGRIGSLQSALDKIQRAPTQQQVQAAMKSSAKWAALQKDFPDFAEAVEERVAGIAQTPGISPEEILRQAREFAEVKVGETHIRTAKTLANIIEPDWEKVSGSQEFLTWLENQPAEVFARASKASAEWDAAEVINLVRSFKASSAPAAAPQRGPERGGRQRLASAAVPTGVTGARAVDEEALDGEALWKHLAKEEARAARRAS